MQQNWEQSLIEKLSFAALREQRASRRWRVFFRLLIIGYIIAMTVFFVAGPNLSDMQDYYDKEHIALIPIQGVIAPDNEANYLDINQSLRKAFDNPQSKSLILLINSPGGSPVQSNLIFQEIRRLREKYPEKKIYAVVEDVAASGAYYIAAAADEIYADPNSLVGSIGVIHSGFGFVEAIEKIGVERRVTTAGGSKNLLDPFVEESANDRAFLRRTLPVIHRQFVEAVKEGRGERINDANSELFQGTVYTGIEAIDNGLIDGLGGLGYVAREVIGIDEYVSYQKKRDIFDRLTRHFNTALYHIRSGIKAAL